MPSPCRIRRARSAWQKPCRTEPRPDSTPSEPASEGVFCLGAKPAPYWLCIQLPASYVLLHGFGVSLAIAHMTTNSLRKRLEEYLLYLFVNNPYLWQLWHCHRLPSRSFRVRNRQFQVCARCTGIFTGATTAPLLFFAHPLGMSILLVAIVLNLVDGGTQLLGLRESNNGFRMLFGVLFGLGLILLFINLMLTSFYV